MTDIIRSRDAKLLGLAASPGVAIGRALRLDERGRRQFYYVEVSPAQVRAEIKRLREAAAEARAQLEEIKTKLTRELGSQHAYILDAHLLMLEDEKLLAGLEAEIKSRRINAEWAVRDVTDRVAAAYRQMRDPYLRERATDIEDLAARLLTILSGHTPFNLSQLEQNVVIVAHDIGPSTVAELNLNRVLAFVTDAGGKTSHSAIIARALGIPAVVGLHDVTRQARTGDAIIVDGETGQVILRPTKPTIRKYMQKQRRAWRPTQPAASEAAETIDGLRIILKANVELPGEVESLGLFGAEGIGLYRSEYLFLNRLPELPTEEEQYQVYRELAEAAGPGGANIRIFDLGGDKLILEGFEEESNPALGLRAIRLSLKVEDIFRTQIKAILRASRHGKLRVVLPLISTLSELRAAKRIIEEVRAELRCDAELEIGVMIEVPAAALMADLFARESDFLSIGTNDLVQYLLAVDRSNENVAHLYRPLHPAVLRTIAHLVKVCRSAGVPLELCGEMASDPLQAAALIGLGLKCLSMAPASIPLIKDTIRAIEYPRARQIVNQAIKLATAEEVEDLLWRELRRIGREPGSVKQSA
jgi:phosphotransferase system enzyme I (PtsI)